MVMKTAIALALLTAASAPAPANALTCKGSITSIQGEGIVARKHHFEVTEVTGDDVPVVLEKCRKIAQERQNRAAKLNPGGTFRKTSEVDLNCEEGGKNFPLRRVIRTQE